MVWHDLTQLAFLNSSFSSLSLATSGAGLVCPLSLSCSHAPLSVYLDLSVSSLHCRILLFIGHLLLTIRFARKKIAISSLSCFISLWHFITVLSCNWGIISLRAGWGFPGLVDGYIHMGQHSGGRS